MLRALPVIGLCRAGSIHAAIIAAVQAAGSKGTFAFIMALDIGRDVGSTVSKQPLENMSDARRLQLLIDAVVDYAIYMIDLEGRVLSWNSGGSRLKGYKADEIIGQSFSRFYTPEDRAAGLPHKALSIAREAGRFSGEGWRVRKDGSRFWALVVIDAIRDENGELIGFAKVTRDITERQEAHWNLLESERRYRRLVESVVDYAIFQLDPTGHVSSWNTGAPAPDATRRKDAACARTAGRSGPLSSLIRFTTTRGNSSASPRSRAISRSAWKPSASSRKPRISLPRPRNWKRSASSAAALPTTSTTC
jgi:PAS domain S-box-containing protein